MDGWERLDEHLPRDVRTILEDRFWRPIEAQATLEALRDDPSFYRDPGRHPAIFADHGIVHVRDVADGVVRILDAADGVLLSPRPHERRAFMAAYGAAAAYLHDVGMIDMSPIGRRVHAAYGAHAAFWPDADVLVEHLLGPGPVGDRIAGIEAVDRFDVDRGTLVREVLSLTAAHSKSTVPVAILDDRSALRRRMQAILATPLEGHRVEARRPGDPEPAPRPGEPRTSHPAPDRAYAWLTARRGPQAELADDVVDTVRALRAADVLRQRGTALRTSAGYEVCFDARTAQAVCTLRSASGDAAYVVTYDDHRGAGEANIRVAFLTPEGDLRIAFHRGGFADGEVAARAAESVANAILDIVADVLPSFGGAPALGLPAPRRSVADVRIRLERPDDRPAFAEDVARVIAAQDPALADHLETVADIEGAAAPERARFYAAQAVGPEDALVDGLIARMAEHGADVERLDRVAAFAEVRRARVHAGERLVEGGSPPAFVYVPMGEGLVVRPGGGYAPKPLNPWVPLGTTGVIRRAERNSDIVAERDVDVIMIPGEVYAAAWLRPLRPEDLRARLRSGGAADAPG